MGIFWIRGSFLNNVDTGNMYQQSGFHKNSIYTVWIHVNQSLAFNILEGWILMFACLFLNGVSSQDLKLCQVNAIDNVKIF